MASFLDELEKIALSGAVPAVPKPPKTSAPTPPPKAKVAPQALAKPPVAKMPAPAKNVIGATSAAQPGLGSIDARIRSSGVVNRRGPSGSLLGQSQRSRNVLPPAESARPQRPLRRSVIRPDMRGVVTNPRVVRRPSFIPAPLSAGDIPL